MKHLCNFCISCYNLFVTLYNRYVDWHNQDATEQGDTLTLTDTYNEQVEEWNRHVDRYNTRDGATTSTERRGK